MIISPYRAWLGIKEAVIVDKVIEDLGSGLNYNRKKWNRLIDSCRIYGLKKYKKKIREDEEVEKSIQDRD